MNLNDAQDELKKYVYKGLDKSDIVVLLESWGVDGEDLSKAYAYLDQVFIERSKNSEYYRFALTDTGNAERLVRDFGENIHYCYERKKWLIWNNQYWEWDNDSKIMAMAKETARGIYREAAEEPDDDKRKALYKHAITTESESKRKSMVELAQSENGIPIKLAEIDSDKWLFNCANGTIDLRTGELRKYTKADLLSNMAPFIYDPKSEGKIWAKFLTKVTGNKPDLISYLQRAVGYSLTADIKEQCLFFLYGLGRNGKSTFVGIIRKMMGPYGHKTNAELLMMHDKPSGPREDLADLIGKRFVVASEIEDGRRLAVVLVKEMTGGETIRAERKYERGFEFQPTHKFWLSGNHKPVITDTTYSIWRRFKLIPFTVTISDTEVDLELSSKLEAELPAILAWAVKGCLEWQKTGLKEPAEVLNATKDYKEEQDELREFIEEKCEVYPSAWVTKSDLSKAYVAWCMNNNLKPISRIRFRGKLIEKEILDAKGTAGVRIWKGITLKGDKEIAQEPLMKEEGSQPQLLPDCLKCGKNEWQYDSSGRLVCPCGYVQEE